MDVKQLAFNPAVELSYLSQTEQTEVVSAMEKYEIKPSLSQAVRLKKMKQSGKLTVDIIDSVLKEDKNGRISSAKSFSINESKRSFSRNSFHIA